MGIRCNKPNTKTTCKAQKASGNQHPLQPADAFLDKWKNLIKLNNLPLIKELPYHTLLEINCNNYLIYSRSKKQNDSTFWEIKKFNIANGDFKANLDKFLEEKKILDLLRTDPYTSKYAEAFCLENQKDSEPPHLHLVTESGAFTLDEVTKLRRELFSGELKYSEFEIYNILRVLSAGLNSMSVNKIYHSNICLSSISMDVKKRSYIIKDFSYALFDIDSKDVFKARELKYFDHIKNGPPEFYDFFKNNKTEKLNFYKCDVWALGLVIEALLAKNEMSFFSNLLTQISNKDPENRIDAYQLCLNVNNSSKTSKIVTFSDMDYEMIRILSTKNKDFEALLKFFYAECKFKLDNHAKIVFLKQEIDKNIENPNKLAEEDHADILNWLYFQLGQAQFQIDEFSEAESSFQSSLSNLIKKDIKNMNFFEIHDSINIFGKLGECLQLQNQLDQALKYLQNKIDALKFFYGTEDMLEILSDKRKKCTILTKLKEFDKARDELENTKLEQIKILGTEIDYEVIETVIALAFNYGYSGNHSQALNEHENALSLNKQLYKTEKREEIAKCYFNIGCENIKLKENKMALESFETAMSILKQISKTEGDFLFDKILRTMKRLKDAIDNQD